MTRRSDITEGNQQVRPRVLVAIANYGTKNQRFLERLLEEYRSMRGFDVDIVVHSNIPKELGPDIEVRVGLPSENPWSLPFAHKQFFAERVEDYDLFIYTEDDTLLTERNLDAFVEVTRVLPQDCIAGFMRFEADPHGRKFCSSIHSHYHWDVHSVVRHGDSLFAYYTNEHAGCFILTRDQLMRAMASGGFLLPPEKRGYGMPETAATDPYTQCGMKKLICISRFDDFCLHHMANAYLGELGLDIELVRLELAKLASFVASGMELPIVTLFEPFPLRDGDRRNKAYYEHRRDDVLKAIPADMRRVLSVGCGCGTTEAELVKCGVAVTAVPLDPVIATSAALKGIEVLPADFRLAAETLGEHRFDCILMLDILQQLDDPVAVIREYREFLDEQGVLLVSVPNWNYCGTLRKRLTRRGRENFECRTSGRKPGVHQTTTGSVTKWLREAGLQRVRRCGMPQARYRRWSKATLGMTDDLLCEKILLLAGR